MVNNDTKKAGCQGKNANLDRALAYRRMGLAVIPMREKGQEKKPYVRWGEYQKKLPTEQEIRDWWSKWPDANIGIVTGSISRLFVLDVDSQEAHDFAIEKGLPDTWTARSGREDGGWHYYFRHPGGKVSNRAVLGGIPGLEVKGDGGIITMPPSRHLKTGNLYQWIKSPEEVELADAPEWLENLIQDRSPAEDEQICGGDNNRKKWKLSKYLEGVKEGERNIAAASVCGYYVEKLSKGAFTDSEARDHVARWNRLNRPPLAQQVLWRTFESIRSREVQKLAKQTENTSFPAEVMTGLAGEFAELYSRHLESPPEFFYMSFQTCLGSAISSGLRLASELAQQPRLFTILLGESADARKSSAMNKTTDFFNIIGNDINSFLTAFSFEVSWGVGSAEGLQKRMDDNPQLLLCLDEFRSFTSKSGIESSVLLPCVNSLFESNRYENQTKKSRITLDDAHLSMLAASTIETWEQIWTPTFTAIGFYNRLFIVPGNRTKRIAFPEKIPQEVKDDLAKRLLERIEKICKLKELAVSEEGLEIYRHWYEALVPSVHTKRLDTYALRFMPLLALSDDKEEVDAETVKKAIALCNWQYKVRQRYDPIDADSNMAKMEGKIRRALRSGEKTLRDLKKAVHAERAGLWVFNTALENLRKSGDIRGLGKNKWELVEN